MDSAPGEPGNSELRPLLRFLRRPAFATPVPGKLTASHWLGWQGLLMLVLVLGGVFDRILLHVFHWPAHSVTLWFLSRPSWGAAALLLLAPALEELGFRAFFSTASKFVFTGLAFFLAYGYAFSRGMVVTPIKLPLTSASAVTHYIRAFWFVLPAGAISLLLYRYCRDAVLRFFQRRAVWVFWISCLVFAAGHTRLYSDSLAWWSFALVLPQFLAGVGLGYVRASFGLRWSIASHYAIDIPFLLFGWLFVWSASSVFLHGMFLTLLVAILAMVAYGLVTLCRVAQLRW
jgi:Type II CAAX prenyl endopeptidase Rce1-like